MTSRGRRTRVTSGVLARILYGEGDIVPINGVLAVILAPGEGMPDEIPETIV